MLRAKLILAGLICASIAPCLSAATPQTQPDRQEIIGTGAPFMGTWLASRANELRKPPTGLSIGISRHEKAISQLLDGSVDFACLDSAALDEIKTRPAELQKRLQWIPIGASSMGFAYHLEGFAGPLVLSADAICGIYEGKITRWNDPMLQRLNHGLLPDKPICLIVPTFGSYNTHLLTLFLSHHSSDWKSRFGVGFFVRWPVGQGLKGDLATVMRSQDGSIGCVGITVDNKEALPNAVLQTSNAELVGPTRGAIEKTVSAAIAEEDGRVDATSLSVKGGYPLVSIAFIVVRQDSPRAAAVRGLAKWFLGGADADAESLGCIRLPTESKKIVSEAAGLSQ